MEGNSQWKVREVNYNVEHQVACHERKHNFSQRTPPFFIYGQPYLINMQRIGAACTPLELLLNVRQQKLLESSSVGCVFLCVG